MLYCYTCTKFYKSWSLQADQTQESSPSISSNRRRPATSSSPLPNIFRLADHHPCSEHSSKDFSTSSSKSKKKGNTDWLATRTHTWPQVDIAHTKPNLPPLASFHFLPLTILPLLDSLPMKPHLKVLLKVLDHTVRQRRVNLARTIDAANPRQIHRFSPFRSARARHRRLGRSDYAVCGRRDEVRLH